jgi:low affinity Fe/Cu permease
LKLDELILATKKARNGMIGAEDLTDEEFGLMKEQIKARAQA